MAAKNNPDKVCVLTSSGVGSLCLLKHYSSSDAKAQPVFIQSGFRWEEAELFWLKKYLRTDKHLGANLPELMQLPLRDVFGMHWSVTGVKVPASSSNPGEMFLPGRTLAMLLKSAVWAAANGYSVIAIGTSKDAGTPDATESFYRDCEHVLRTAVGASLRIEAPFIARSREDILFEAKDIGPELTFSCANPKGFQHCGECFKCHDRKRSFTRTGVTDKTHYFSKATVKG